MKPILSILALCAALLFTGCASPDRPGGSKPTPQAIAYDTLRDTWDTVDGAMRVYGVAVVNGKVSESTERKIDAAHEKFRTAFKSAVRLAERDYSALTPNHVRDLAAEVVKLINALN